MKLKKSFQLAVNILIHSKLRSWLTILGIVIGVAAVVAIVSIGEGAQASVNARLSGLGADMITVSPGFQRAGFGGFGRGGEGSDTTNSKSKNLTIKDVQIIKSIPGISFIDGIISGRADMTYLAQTTSASVQGVDALAWSNMVTTELESGRYLNAGDSNALVVVLGYRLATTTFKQQLAVNRMVTIGGKQFKIVGILQQSGSGLGGGGDNAVIMPISAARQILENKGGSYLDSISIKASSTDLVDQLTNETDAKLMLTRHVTSKTKDYSVTSAKATMQSIQSVTQTFTLFLAAIAAVSLIVGAVGIANTMFTSVMEKTREIGVMKAIGAKNIDIMAIFLLNSALVGLVGGIIGILLGAAISGILPNVLGSSFGLGGLGGRGGIITVIPLSLMIEALLLSMAIGMVAGAIPAYRASKLKPVDALRYE
jgi:putative ABC transport system permease protein